MANTIISPNMNLPVPVVSVDPGPDWATNVDACLNIVDSHNHSTGQGVQIGVNGLNINGDLPMNGNNLTTIRTTRFSAQVSPIAASAPDLGCLYVSGADLYYNDENGNQVRITQSGAVTGASGTITGLSSPASAVYAGSTFTFESAANTPAAINAGPLTIGQAVASGYGVTISASGSEVANYNLTLPGGSPSLNQILISDGSGNFSWYSINAGTFSPTVTQTLSSGSSVTISVISSAWYYTQMQNIITVSGSVAYNVSGFTAPGTYSWKATIPIATASLVPNGFFGDAGSGTTTSILTAVPNTAVTTDFGVTYSGNVGHSIVFNYMYKVT